MTEIEVTDEVIVVDSDGRKRAGTVREVHENGPPAGETVYGVDMWQSGHAHVTRDAIHPVEDVPIGDDGTTRVSTDALDVVLQWSVDTGVDYLQEDDAIVQALVELWSNRHNDHLCEQCVLPQSASYRLPDGTCVCTTHYNDLGDVEAEYIGDRDRRTTGGISHDD